MSGGAPGPGPMPDPELRAAEYALGTLDAQERAALERDAAGDPETAGRIHAWERRLAPLMGAVPPVAPPPRVRAALLRALPDGADGAGTSSATCGAGCGAGRSRRRDPACSPPASRCSWRSAPPGARRAGAIWPSCRGAGRCRR